MIVFSGMALALACLQPSQASKGRGPKYGCPKVNTKATQLQETINLFIMWLLSLILTPGFNHTDMGFT